MDQKYKQAILNTVASAQQDAPDCPCTDAFLIIYDGTPKGSAARRLLIDMYAYGAYNAPDWNKEFELLLHEALVDIMCTMIRVRRENLAGPWTETMEAYQELE
jgi:hypothetical protein